MKTKMTKNILSIIILIGLVPFVTLSQNCPANINNSPGNSPFTVEAKVFDSNGEKIKEIICERTGSSQHIDCDLESRDLTGALYIVIELNAIECLYDVDGNNIGVLPFEFGGMNIERLHDENIITWKTYSEQDNDFFTLEYSFDGEAWEELTIVEGAGNTNTESNYQFRHRVSGFKTMYYRLSQTDFYGTTVLLKTMAIQNQNSDPISIELSSGNAKIFSDAEITEILLSDIQGRKINFDRVTENNSFIEIDFNQSQAIKVLTVIDINGNTKRVKLL